jgi:hypothetical protein
MAKKHPGRVILLSRVLDDRQERITTYELLGIDPGSPNICGKFLRELKNLQTGVK